MKKILVIAEKPTPQNPKYQYAWGEMASSLKTLSEQTAGISYLGGGSLLIEEEVGMPALGSALRLFDSLELSYRTLFIESHTEWRKVYE